MVIFAAGIRPRDELAAAAGLTLAERGGVLTDLSCQTSDPDIYAIGEVAAIDGRCYGLVGPGYTSAEVVADRLLGGAAEFAEARHVHQAQTAGRRRRQLRRRDGQRPRTASRSPSTTR